MTKKRKTEVPPPTPRSRYALRRDALRGGPPREEKPHGTYAAARRHFRAATKAGRNPTEECKACRIVGPTGKTCHQAWLEYQAEQYQKNTGPARKRARGAA